MTNNDIITIEPKNIKSILFFDDSFKTITNNQNETITANFQPVSYLVSINHIKSLTFDTMINNLTIKSDDFDFDITVDTLLDDIYALVDNVNDVTETEQLNLKMLKYINCVMPDCDLNSDKYDELKQNLDDDDNALSLFHDNDNYKHCALKSEHISRFENTEFHDDVIDDDDNQTEFQLNIYDKNNNKYIIANDMYDVSVSTFDDD